MGSDDRDHSSGSPGARADQRWALLVPVAAAFLLPVVQAAAQPDGRELFEARIRPLLIDRCYACHNTATSADGGLALDSRDGLRAGGDSGPAIVPGDPAASLLVRVLRHEVEGLKMPKDSGRLSAEAIADV
ncbi:MAG: c-type cytochrome domain-containing protein, partial [Actinomycetota bacterium]